MMKSIPYFKQLDLLISILPDVLADQRLALKGGTAINLFFEDLPRLSVDIDLVYLPLDIYDVALKNVRDILDHISTKLQNKNYKVQIAKDYRIFIATAEATVKVEFSPVIRGSVHFPIPKPLCEKAQDLFKKYVEARCLDGRDLYAGKICAALDRQHPRDLFDMHNFFKNNSYNRALHLTFLAYLISHPRPISELLKPNKQDLSRSYNQEFLGMTEEIIPLAELENTFDHLVKQTLSSMTLEDKEFLLSFKQGAPKWHLMPFENIQNMPTIKWKLQNISQMDKNKHAKAIKALEQKLS